ncbi:MAG: antibiotic biosynthesis monooxygenase [Acidimicrobiales bacterium]
MTVIKINAITVPAESGDELARRFANRAGAVDGADGFEGFELMRPVDDRETWLVVTRWRDDAAFEAWVASPAFGHGHRGSSEGSGAHGSRSAHGSGGAHGGHGGDSDAAPPVSMSSELWAYEVVDLSSPE